MPITRSLFLALPVSLAVATLFVPFPRTVAAPDPTTPEPTKPPTGIEVEVKCVDDSALKIRILDEKLELVTKYGFLQIATSDIRRIEFASRCPPDVAEKIVTAVSRLGHADFQIREQASADVRKYRERAYPYLIKALKHEDPEVSRRADEAIKFLQLRVPAAQLEAKDYDVVHTEDCKITGKLTAQNLRVSTSMFGEQQLKLADMRTLRSAAGVVAEELAAAPPAPANLMSYQQQFGKELTFTLTGFTPGAGQQASVWGTDVYTLDTNLAAAAVHAGIAKPGEAVAVRLRVVQSPAQYVASARNGISSNAYGNYNAGGFEFVRRCARNHFHFLTPRVSCTHPHPRIAPPSRGVIRPASRGRS